MAAITELINKSTTWDGPDFVVPAISANVVGRDGKSLYHYAKGIGKNESQKVTGDSVFWLGSQSKLMATVACLQTVEQGLIGLDDDVAEILPDLAKLEVLDGEEDSHGVPTTKPRQNKITPRLLLSHQSGLGYDILPMTIAKWVAATGLKHTILDSDQESMKRCPLAFEPGTSWVYGAGLDWTGELVARLQKTTLEEYYKAKIWGPLGMSSTTFHPMQFKDRIVQTYLRGEDGKFTPIKLDVPIEPPKETAGHGVWSTSNDYIKLLSALLDGGGPILKKASVDEIFTPQLRVPESIGPVVHGIYKPALAPSIPLDQTVNHGLAGLINLNDFAGRRPAGTLQWSGAPNLIWWVDRKTGIAATTFLQIMPVGDTKAGEFNVAFEEAVYKAFSS